jgi:hypothetical protein
MSAGRLLTTPWTRAMLKSIDFDWNEAAQRVPDDTVIHLSGKGPRGPWYVRGFVNGREVIPFTGREDPGYRDLGHAIEYVIEVARGVVASGR